MSEHTETFVLDTVSGRIRWRLRARELSLKQLAERASLKYRTLQNYVADTNRMPAEALGRIAKALDVSVDWLLTGEAPPVLHNVVVECISYAHRLKDEHPFEPVRLAGILTAFYELRYSQEMAGGAAPE